MTGREVIPIAPPGLGEVLASPSAYAEAMYAGQTLRPAVPVPASAPIARRGRVRRAAAVGVAVVAAAGLALAGCAGARHAQAGCRVPDLPAGTRIWVDAHGDAWTPGSHVPGPVRVFTCRGGAWVQVP